MRAVVTALVVSAGLVVLMLPAPVAMGDHSLNNDIRRWPFWWHEQRCINQGWGGTTSHNVASRYYAIDFGTPCNTNAYAWAIRSAADGVVQCVQNDPDLGNYVKIVAPDGLTDIYAHKPSCDVPIGA